MSFRKMLLYEQILCIFLIIFCAISAECGENALISKEESNHLTGNVTTVSGIDLTLTCNVKLFECGNFYSVELYHESTFDPETSVRRVFIYHHQAGIFKSEGGWLNRVSYSYDKKSHLMKLHLKRVTLTDEGVYRCEITYEDPDRWFSNLCFSPQILNVKVLQIPAYIHLYMGNGTLIQNGSVVGPFYPEFSLILICVSGSGKPSPEVKWWNGTEEIRGAWNWKIEHYNKTQSLKSEIQLKLSRQHQGNQISCAVNSEALDAPLLATTFIDMETPPESLIIARPIRSAVEGLYFSVTCVAFNAKPPAYIYWNSEPLLNFDNVTENTEMDGKGYSTTSTLTFVAKRHLTSLSCFASNDVLDQIEGTHLRVDTTINVRYKPKITEKESDRDIRVFVGEDVALNCSYDANPTGGFVTWYLNGFNVTASGTARDTSSTLRLNNMTIVMGGIYSCMVENEVGKSPIVNLATVIVETKPNAHMMISPHDPVFESQSKNVTLVCLTDGESARFSEVKWFLNGELLKHVSTKCTNEFRQCDVDPSKIILVNVKRAFRGNYSCQGRYRGVWSVVSGNEEIRIHYPPKLKSVQTVPKVILRGHPFKIECVLEDYGFPPANKVIWYKNGRKIEGESSFNIYVGRADSTNDGEYSCVPFSSISMTEKSDIFLRIICLPKFLKSLPPETVVLEKDDLLKLRCAAQCADPCDLYWLLNDDKSSRVSNITNYSREIDEKSLYRIESEVTVYVQPNLKVSTYTCRVISAGAESIESTTNIKSYFSPRNIFTFKSYKNFRVIFQCHAEANPTAQYKWYDFNGKILSTKPTLVLKDSFIQHEDKKSTYSCTARNDFGSAESSIFIDHNNISECRIRTNEMNNGSVNLECFHFKNYRVFPSYSWYYNGRPLKTNGSLLTTEGFGYYTCVLKNNLEETTCTAYLKERFYISQKSYLWLTISIVVFFLIAGGLICLVRIGQRSSLNDENEFRRRRSNEMENPNFEANSDINSLIRDDGARDFEIDRNKRCVIVSNSRQTEHVWLV